MQKKLLLYLIFIIFIQSGYSQNKKAIFIILDGIPAEEIQNTPTPNLDDISRSGGFAMAYVGGLKEGYSETPTISAVGYNSLITGTWYNKHNVKDNQIRQPNYHYRTIFRHFKNNYPNKKTAIYSTWLDNRTKLIGENLEETGYLNMDYHFDGLEVDTIAIPHDSLSKYILEIDRKVSAYAARDIREKSPDLTWVYLQYTDDMGHKYGKSPEMTSAIIEADRQVGKIRDAIQYRQKEWGENWLIIITTDHGRTVGGFHHGGQTNEERSTWMISNLKFNAHFQNIPGIVDIFPTIATFVEISIPKNAAMELDGVSLLGKAYASNLQASIQQEQLKINWDHYGEKGKAPIWITGTNQFRYGKADQYYLLGEVNLEAKEALLDIKGYEFDNFKIVMELPNGYINTWLKKD